MQLAAPASMLPAGFSVPQISRLVGVSVNTVRRRMTLYGLSVQSLYSPLNDTNGGLRSRLPQFMTARVFSKCSSEGITGHCKSSTTANIRQYASQIQLKTVDPGPEGGSSDPNDSTVSERYFRPLYIRSHLHTRVISSFSSPTNLFEELEYSTSR